MGSPTIFKGSRTKLLTANGLETKDNQFIDYDGDLELCRQSLSSFTDGSYSAAARPTGSFTSGASGLVTSSATPFMGKKFAVTLTKTGACQGAASIQEYDLPEGLRAKVLCLKVDYRVASGTFNAGSTSSDSDLIFYIEEHNGTSWQKKEPSTFKLFSNSSTIADQYSGYFQTNADTTKIRIIAYVATTGNNNFSLVCSFSLRATKYVYGTPITDWVKYTPVISTLSGTITNYTTDFYYKKIGDSVMIKGTIYFTGPSGTWQQLRFSLPSGLQMIPDQNALEDQVGIWNSYDYGVQNWGTGFVYRLTNSVFALRVNNTTVSYASGQDTSSTVPFSFGNQDSITITPFIVPIQGWSSSVKMSDGYDGREIAASYATNVGGSIPTGTTVFIDFYNKFYDLTNSVVGAGNGHSTNWQNTWRYIAPVSGYYSIKAVITLLFPPNTNAEAFAEIWVNGQMKIRGARSRYVVPATDTEPRGMVVVGDVYVKAGDAISISIFHNSGANRSLEGGFEVNLVHIHRISSPQTIAMGEVVAGYAKNASGQVIPNNTVTTLTGWTTVTDTHAIFNPSTGVLTVNRSGFIDLSAIVSFSPNSTGDRSILFVLNNTTEIGVVDIRAVSGGITTGVSTSISCYPVKSGDTFIVRAYQSSGGNLAIFGDRTLLSWRIY